MKNVGEYHSINHAGSLLPTGFRQLSPWFQMFPVYKRGPSPTAWRSPSPKGRGLFPQEFRPSPPLQKAGRQQNNSAATPPRSLEGVVSLRLAIRHESPPVLLTRLLAGFL